MLTLSVFRAPLCAARRAASSAMRAKIPCGATQRIVAGQPPVNRLEDRQSKGPEVSTGTWRNVETGRVISQRLPSYADLHILRPNSSWAYKDKC